MSTPNDFGVQGQLPTHPELLDWLAVDFSEDWNVKKVDKKNGNVKNLSTKISNYR